MQDGTTLAKYHQKHLNWQLQYSNGGVMIWASFAGTDHKRLCIPEHTKVVPVCGFIQHPKLRQNWVMQQDNDSKHRNKSPTELLTKKKSQSYKNNFLYDYKRP